MAKDSGTPGSVSTFRGSPGTRAAFRAFVAVIRADGAITGRAIVNPDYYYWYERKKLPAGNAYTREPAYARVSHAQGRPLNTVCMRVVRHVAIGKPFNECWKVQWTHYRRVFAAARIRTIVADSRVDRQTAVLHLTAAIAWITAEILDLVIIGERVQSTRSAFEMLQCSAVWFRFDFFSVLFLRVDSIVFIAVSCGTQSEGIDKSGYRRFEFRKIWGKAWICVQFCEFKWV